MKKLLVILSFLLVPSIASATDTITYWKHSISRGGIREYRWSLNVDTDGDADGSASAKSDPIYGYIIEFKITHDSTPGTSGTSPSVNYDLEIRDENNFDWLFGEMASGNTSETDSSNVDVPLTDTGAYLLLHGERLFPYITSSNTSAFDITIYLRVKEK